MIKNNWRAVRYLVVAFAVSTGLGCGSRQAVTGDNGDSGLDTVMTHDLPADSGIADSGAVDSGMVDVSVQDVGMDVGTTDMNLAFPAVLEGVWLIGWSGGMNHFSWVRFSKMATPSMSKKDAWILDGKAITSNLPLWNCNGKTSYSMGAAYNTIYLDFPSTDCLPGGAPSKGYIFSNFNTSGGGAPSDVILSANVQDQGTLKEFSGYKYPDYWCDAAMTSCKAPW